MSFRYSLAASIDRHLHQTLFSFSDSDGGARNGHESGPDFELTECGYSWPSSRLTFEDMRKLATLNEAIGVPITKPIHEAVEFLGSRLAGDTCRTVKSSRRRSFADVLARRVLLCLNRQHGASKRDPD